MDTGAQATHEVDFEGEEAVHRHPRFNLVAPRSYESIAFTSSYNGSIEGRNGALPICRPASYYAQQIRLLTATIRLLAKYGEVSLAAALQHYFARGFAHERLMQTDEAIKDYNMCIRLDNRFTPAYFNRALIHYDRFEFQLALEDITSVIKLDPKQPRYYELRSLLLRQLNRVIPAGTDLEVAQRLRRVAEDERSHSSSSSHCRGSRQATTAVIPTATRSPAGLSTASLGQQQQQQELAPPRQLVYMTKRLTTARRTVMDVPPELLAQRLMEKPPDLRSPTDIQRIAHELKKVDCLRKLEKDYNALSGIASAITLRRYSRDKYVFKTGDVGTLFYILYEGSIMITAKSQERQAEIVLKRLNRGDGFGEGVLYNPSRTRTANAFCETDSIVLALPLSVYVDLMNNVTDRLKLLSHCVIFSSWSEERRLEVANKMRPKQFDTNATILRAGELVQELYIIKTGMARVLKRVPAALLRKRHRRPRTTGSTTRGPDRTTRQRGRGEEGQVDDAAAVAAASAPQAEVPGFWAIEEENWLDREDDAPITDPLAVKSYELTVGVLGSCQVIGELCILNPSTPSPVTVVAYTIIELYAIKKEELEAMGCSFEVPLTYQLNESMALHNPSSEKVGYLFRRQVQWEKEKEALLDMVMPRKWIESRREKRGLPLDAARTYNTLVLRQAAQGEGDSQRDDEGSEGSGGGGGKGGFKETGGSIRGGDRRKSTRSLK